MAWSATTWVSAMKWSRNSPRSVRIWITKSTTPAKTTLMALAASTVTSSLWRTGISR